MFGDGTSQRDYTFVEDVVDGVVRAIDRPCGFKVYNLGRSQPIALINVVRVIEHLFDKRASIEWLPVQAGDVSITYADIAEARRELGYSPRVTLEDGIRRFILWRTDAARLH